MGYTRNKRRANNFRKSRQLQINKKATRRQYKGGARQTKRRGQKGGANGEFNAADCKDALQRNLDDLFAKYHFIVNYQKDAIDSESVNPLTGEQQDVLDAIKRDLTLKERYKSYQKDNNNLVEKIFGAKTGSRIGRIINRKLRDGKPRSAVADAFGLEEAEEEERAATADAEAAKIVMKKEAVSRPVRSGPRADGSLRPKAQAAVDAEEAAVAAKENTKILEGNKRRAQIDKIFTKGGTITLSNVKIIKTKTGNTLLAPVLPREPEVIKSTDLTLTIPENMKDSDALSSVFINVNFKQPGLITGKKNDYKILSKYYGKEGFVSSQNQLGPGITLNLTQDKVSLKISPNDLDEDNISLTINSEEDIQVVKDDEEHFYQQLNKNLNLFALLSEVQRALNGDNPYQDLVDQEINPALFGIRPPTV